MHVLITNNLYVIALGIQAIFEFVRGSFDMSFHSPLYRLTSFFNLLEGVFVGLIVELGPCTGTPAWAQELSNYHYLHPPHLLQHPLPLGPYPTPWAKEGQIRDREKTVIITERERTVKTRRKR